MTRENVKKNMDIISAFAEDKVIQIINEKGEWVDLTERDGLPIETIAEDPSSFRIKPESKYRPFNNTEECWQEMQKHSPFGWVINKKDNTRHLVTMVEPDGSVIISYEQNRTKRGAFEDFTFADRVPFGVKVEEG